jgi:hypothetical protein
MVPVPGFGGKLAPRSCFLLPVLAAVTLAGTLLILIVVSTVAIAIPALRAARVLPNEALRVDGTSPLKCSELRTICEPCKAIALG